MMFLRGWIRCYKGQDERWIQISTITSVKRGASGDTTIINSGTGFVLVHEEVQEVMQKIATECK